MCLVLPSGTRESDKASMGLGSDGKTSFPVGISGPVSWVSFISTNDPGVRPPAPAPLPPSPHRPPRTSEPAYLPLPLPPLARLRCPDSGTWGTALALLAPRAAFATAGCGFWASGGKRALARPAESEIWYPGRGRGPLGPEGRLRDRGIWFLGICRQEGAGPAGWSLKSGILVGVGAALLCGSGSRILVSDILRFWNPESGNRDLESGNRDLETWNPRGPS